MPPTSDAIAKWVDAHCVRLCSPFNGEATDPEVLALLDINIADADFVFLGETDHFVHEKADFRLLFCRYLMSRGWHSFAEELGWSDGVRVNRYLSTGDETSLARLSLFGYRTDLRPDRDDRPTGLLGPSFDKYPTELMKAEQEWFYRGLRRAADGRPLSYHGFDIDALPGGAYADIIENLASSANLPKVRAFLSSLAQVPGETAAQEAARLTTLLPSATALDEEVNSIAAEVEISLKAMVESLTYVERTYPAQTYDALRPGMAFREGCMKRRFADIRRVANDAPTVVMGHALHLAKDDHLMGQAVGIGHGGGLECSVGHHLVQSLGYKAVSIWMIHGTGEDSQPFPDLPRQLSYPPTTLNARLSELRDPVLFRINDAARDLWDKSVGIGHMYNTIQQTVLAGQVDAILYLPKVTPLRTHR